MFIDNLPSTPTEIANYALRELGAPVINIDVSPDQVSDRVNEALNYAMLYLWDFNEEVFLPYQIRPALLTINVDVTTITDAVLGGNITFQAMTSGIRCTALVVANGAGLQLSTMTVSPALTNFIVGESLNFGTGIDATITAYTPGDCQNGYISTPVGILGVSGVESMTGGYNSNDIFNVQYQLRLNDLFNIGAVDIQYYASAMQYLSLLDLELNGHVRYRFNRFQQRLYLDINWEYDLVPGQYIAINATNFVDPDLYGTAYSDPWLLRYTTALIKKQWGSNLKKFGAITLPGGVTLNGKEIYDEAVVEQKELEVELQGKQRPLSIFIG